jgi:hypothetical protein
MNEDPQVILFVNDKLRPACDAIVTAIRTLRQLSADYTSQGIAAQIGSPADAVLLAQTVADGSSVDGRNTLTGSEVAAAISATNQLITLLDASPTIETRLRKPSVNNRPVF